MKQPPQHPTRSDDRTPAELLEALRTTLDGGLYALFRAILNTIERLDVWQQKIIEYLKGQGIEL